jgi:hypothetical protein
VLGARLGGLESRLEAQLGNLRADVKQAIALSASSARNEADADAAARCKELERRFTSQLHGAAATLRCCRVVSQ